MDIWLPNQTNAGYTSKKKPCLPNLSIKIIQNVQVKEHRVQNLRNALKPKTKGSRLAKSDKCGVPKSVERKVHQ